MPCRAIAYGQISTNEIILYIHHNKAADWMKDLQVNKNCFKQITKGPTLTTHLQSKLFCTAKNEFEITAIFKGF
jgi:hypothetical protein